MAAKKKSAKKTEAKPLAGRYVVVVGPSVVVANHTANAIQKKQKLKERPVAVRNLPRGLGAHDKVAVVTVGNTALSADWCDDMERRLEDIKFFNEAELV